MQAKVIRERKINPGYKLGAPAGQSGFSRTRIVKDGKKSYDEIVLVRKSAIKDKLECNENLRNAKGVILEMLLSEKSVPEIVVFLNSAGLKTSSGEEKWAASQVWRIINRHKKEESAEKLSK